MSETLALGLDRPGDPGRGSRGRVDAALAAMVGRIAIALTALDVPEGAALATLDPGPPAWSPDGGVIGLPHGEPEPVDRLLSAVGATAADRDLLALSLVSHHDAVVAAALRTLHPEGRPWVSLGLAAVLAERRLLAGLTGRADLAATLAESALVDAGAVTVEGTGPVPERTLRPGPLVWEGLTGLPGWPPGFEVDPLPAPDWGLGPWLATDLVSGARRAIQQARPAAFVLVDERPEVTAARLSVLVTRAGRRPVVLRTDQLAAASLQEVLLLGVLRDVVPVLCETGAAHDHRELVVPPLPVPLLVARRTGGLTLWPRPAVFLPTTVLTAPERSEAVRAAVPELPRAQAVGSVTLEPRDLDLAASGLRARARTAGALQEGPAGELLLQELDRRTAGTVPEGATLRHPRVGWADLVLPAERTEMLEEAVERCRIQQDLGALTLGHGRAPVAGARGLRMLFTGPPGTGKTLSAEVVAAALGRVLLVADLSRLVSKWIGETEKNLAAMFDAGERTDTVLFFDEADALFGKRTEVGDARDRYANLETAYLLSRLERYDGVVVLATNLRRNIDTAFSRRIEFVVPFDPPDDAARLRLWRLHVPGWASLADDVDLHEIALMYDVSGALIRNASLSAAFLAEADRRRAGLPDPPRIRTGHLVHALRREHAKAGLAFPGPHLEVRPPAQERECP
jgi:hypothetical protein